MRAQVSKLLAEATPLPWRQEETHRIVSATYGDIGPVADCYESMDAALIVYAVNRLPDYEAAADVLQRMVNLWGPTDHHPALDDARAALARLREKEDRK